MGAIASGGVRVLNEDLLARLGSAMGNLNPIIDRVAAEETVELQRREIAYRDDRPAPDMEGKTVIVVDDGLATGSTMRAAVRALRRHAVARIVVAVPVGSPDTCDECRAEADDVVCAITPLDFGAVGQFYDDFSQTTDDEVRELLALAAEQLPATARAR
jgi:predicted phosphoribosyltransferase